MADVISVSTTISADTIASEMVNDGRFAMEVLAALADRDDGGDGVREIASGGNGSHYHAEVAPFLRRLADAISLTPPK